MKHYALRWEQHEWHFVIPSEWPQWRRVKRLMRLIAVTVARNQLPAGSVHWTTH